MESLNEKRWQIKKNEYKEEDASYQRICELVNNTDFLIMIRRMNVGEVLIYNEKNIEFKRTK